MPDIPHPRLVGFAAGVLLLVLGWGIAQVVFHEPSGPPQQVYIVQ